MQTLGSLLILYVTNIGFIKINFCRGHQVRFARFAIFLFSVAATVVHLVVMVRVPIHIQLRHVDYLILHIDACFYSLSPSQI